VTVGSVRGAPDVGDEPDPSDIFFEKSPVPLFIADLDSGRILRANEAALRQYRYPRAEFLDLPLRGLWAEGEFARFVAAVRNSGGAGLRSAGVFGQVRKDGSPIQTDIWHQDLPLPGHTALLVSAPDVTEHARAAAAEAEQRALAEALRDSAAALNSTLDFDEVLTRILENTARVMPHDTVDIMRVDRGVARIVRGRGFERFGLEETQVLDLEFPLDRFPNLRLLAETHQPRVTADTRTDPLWVEVAGLEWVRSHVGSPIVSRDRLIGVLNLSSATQAFYTPQDAPRLRAFADQSAIALENSRLYSEVRASRERLQALSIRLLDVQEAERRFIASELHDEIGQSLTGLKLLLDMASTGRGPKVRERLEESRRMAAELMDRVQDLSLDLRPSMLDDLGLLPALLSLMERFSSRSGVEVDFEHQGIDTRFDPRLETAAYRIVQEAITNAARHSGARQASVRVSVDGQALVLRIEDRGRGFDASGLLARYESSGLSGMQERARLSGGDLTIESAPGNGTRLVARLPLQGHLERRRRGGRA
jgi:signal transduction histidine kinase